MRVRHLGPVLAVLLGATLLLPAGAGAAEEPDTTPPQVALDPCPETPVGEPCSQREVAWVAQQQVDEAEGLAVAGVREGDTVLTEHVYDDGSGFEPYGPFGGTPYGDALSEHDYVTEAWIGPGLHELTFYARDLAGNEATVTRTVIGPEVPSQPLDFRAERSARRGTTDLSWLVDSHGSLLQHQVVRVKGVDRFKIDMVGLGASPGVEPVHLSLPLEPGRQVVRIFAVNVVGKGEAQRFVFRVPQPRRAR